MFTYKDDNQTQDFCSLFWNSWRKRKTSINIHVHKGQDCFLRLKLITFRISQSLKETRINILKMLTSCSISSSDMSSSSSSKGHSSHLKGEIIDFFLSVLTTWATLIFPLLFVLPHLDWSMPNWFSGLAWQEEPTHSQQPSWNHLRIFFCEKATIFCCVCEI